MTPRVDWPFVAQMLFVAWLVWAGATWQTFVVVAALSIWLDVIWQGAKAAGAWIARRVRR